jgi:hypothetical protein
MTQYDANNQKKKILWYVDPLLGKDHETNREQSLLVNDP